MATPRQYIGNPEIEKRVRELHAQGLGRNAIARQIGCADSTLSKIAARLGLSFDRTRTAEATRAKQVDAAARRADLSATLLEDAHRLRAQLWEPTRHGSFGGKDNVWSEIELDEPTFADKRNILSAVSTAVRDHIRLTEVDADGGAAEHGSMLAELMTGLQAAHAARFAHNASEPGGQDINDD